MHLINKSIDRKEVGRTFEAKKKACPRHKVSRSIMPNSLPPHGLYSPWNSPGQNTGVGSLSLLQRIFPTQESNWGLLHCRWSLHCSWAIREALKAQRSDMFGKCQKWIEIDEAKLGPNHIKPSRVCWGICTLSCRSGVPNLWWSEVELM